MAETDKDISCAVTNKLSRTQAGDTSVVAFMTGAVVAANMFSEDKDVAHGTLAIDATHAFQWYCREHPDADIRTALLMVLGAIRVGWEAGLLYKD
jgi:hypothetical protein